MPPWWAPRLHGFSQGLLVVRDCDMPDEDGAAGGGVALQSGHDPNDMHLVGSHATARVRPWWCGSFGRTAATERSWLSWRPLWDALVGVPPVTSRWRDGRAASSVAWWPVYRM